MVKNKHETHYEEVTLRKVIIGESRYEGKMTFVNDSIRDIRGDAEYSATSYKNNKNNNYDGNDDDAYKDGNEANV